MNAMYADAVWAQETHCPGIYSPVSWTFLQGGRGRLQQRQRRHLGVWAA
jgi:hypothetical protein